jgi:hypothetical protein
MNEHFEKHNKNHYEGNGWSKYQLLVLQQLDDHNKVLQNLNKELVDIKQVTAVSDTETKLWKAQMMSSVDDIETKLDNILYDERGLTQRLSNLERDAHVEETTSAKMKAAWAFYGAILVFASNIALKLVEIYFKQ